MVGFLRKKISRIEADKTNGSVNQFDVVQILPDKMHLF